jgi:hypothetical protein
MIGKYKILGIIAKGGMGIVYKAIHPSLKRYVIIKKLTARGKSGNAERFKKEAQILLDLQSPYIVHLFDYFTEAGYRYMVEELVDGLALDGLMKKQTSLPCPIAMLFMQDACFALKYAFSLPFQKTVPSVGSTRPRIIPAVVVLPQPLSPTRPTASFVFNTNDRSWTAENSLYFFVTWRNSISDILPIPLCSLPSVAGVYSKSPDIADICRKNNTHPLSCISADLHPESDTTTYFSGDEGPEYSEATLLYKDAAAF